MQREFLEPGFGYIVQTGLENATLRNLCKATKISSGSLYYWFDNIEELYVNIAKYGFKKSVNELRISKKMHCGNCNREVNPI